MGDAGSLFTNVISSIFNPAFEYEVVGSVISPSSTSKLSTVVSLNDAVPVAYCIVFYNVIADGVKSNIGIVPTPGFNTILPVDVPVSHSNPMLNPPEPSPAYTPSSVAYKPPLVIVISAST